MNSGDTAWILTSTIFVLFMTLPGIAMFYGGLMHSRSVLSVMMQCFSITSISTLLWLYIGYALAFGDSVGGVIGSIANGFFVGLADGGSQSGVPDIAWAVFHMTFAILTPALIVGSYTERIKFPAVLVFSALWSTLVYAPICHWVWGGGWLSEIGIMDSAGGVTLHVSVGIAGLIAAIVIGKRLAFPSELPEPHNPGLAATGVGMLWIGWLALNGGMQVFAGREPGISVAVTHIAAAAAVITWMTVQWIMERRPTLVGTATGAIAGLAIATPASAFVSPLSGLVLGAIAGIVCYFAVG
ncbi:MAG: ammonium transporter, partial [Dehalococcoidia bacterium]|nr:ammonium transporter [Dehalococcoidia bacterium]